MNALRYGKIRKWINTAYKWLPVFFFLFVFCLYYSLLGTPYFTDEQDVYYGGYSLLKGGELYRTYLTQHMPFSYYFAWIPALLGARTVFQFRLVFYVLLSAVWTAAYVHHRNDLPRIMLWGTPLLYLSMLKTQLMGTSLISDHWQGIGFILIFWEMLRYPQTWKLSISSCVMIALGIVLSFGTAFISAYTLLCFFLSAAGSAALRYLVSGKEEKEALSGAGQDLLKLAAICVLPFLVLAGIYFLRGQFRDFWNGAYILNREVYSKYTGGFGTDAGAAAIQTPVQFWKFTLECIRSIGANPSESLMGILQVAALMFCAVGEGRRKPIMGLGIFLATVYAGIRGFNGFHAMPWYALTAAEMMWCVGKCLKWSTKQNGYFLVWAPRAAAAVVTLILLADCALPLGYNLLMPQILMDPVPDSLDDQILLLTDENEKIHACGTSHWSLNLMQTERVPDDLCLAASNPWYYEVYGSREVEQLQKNQTNLLLYSPDNPVWGYTARNYAKEFQDYVDTHYTPVEQGSSLMIRNEFLPEARKRLAEAGYGVVVTSLEAGMEVDLAEDFYPGDSVTQVFRAEGNFLNAVHIRVGPYHGRSRIRLRLELYDAESGALICQEEMPSDRIADSFFCRCSMQCEVRKGNQYELKILLEEAKGRGKAVFYFTPSGTASEDFWAIRNGEKLDQCIPLQLEYDPSSL